jgi:hypothetical protein
MANNSTRSAKTKVIHAGFLLADPDTQPKSEQSILIEGERIKAVSGGFIDPPPMIRRRTATARTSLVRTRLLAGGKRIRTAGPTYA